MKINPWVIALDTTHEYNIANEDAPHIEKIEGVYLFDRNTVTHCGSTQPSYSLRYLYTIITVVEGLSGRRRGDLEEKYAYEPCNDTYAPTNLIDRIIEEGDPSLVGQYDIDEGPYVGCSNEDRLYAIGEDYICNRPL